MTENVITSTAQEGKEPTKAKKSGFASMREPELRAVVREYGIEDEDLKTHADLVAALAEEGIQYDDYKQLVEAGKAEDEDEVKEVVQTPKKSATSKSNEVLVKMERQNFHFEIFGHTFTKEHPYVLMSSEDAQEIFDHEEGFRIAQPREAQEYYS